MNTIARATLALVPAAFVLMPAAAPAVESDGSFTVVGHRGDHSSATENTMPAFRAALRGGAGAVEADVTLTKDRAFLLMHDMTLDRTTNCRGPVVRRTLEGIRSRCFGSRRREPIPTAAELVAWASKHGMKLVLEVKPATRMDVADYRRLAAVLDQHSMMGRTIIHSFGLQRLRTAERADPRFHTQLITRSWSQVASATSLVDGFNIYARFLTRARVRTLHQEGLFVLGRNTSRPVDWKRIRRSGADGMVTDAVAHAVRFHRRR